MDDRFSTTIPMTKKQASNCLHCGGCVRHWTFGNNVYLVERKGILYDRTFDHYSENVTFYPNNSKIWLTGWYYVEPNY